MFESEYINNLIALGDYSGAMSALDNAIACDPTLDEAFFMRGKLQWRLGNHPSAITDFETALALNPDSKARHALEMARDITDFFNPDLLNP